MSLSSVYERIERVLGEAIVAHREVRGGSIAGSHRLQLTSGREVFVKTGAQYPDMFPKEANGLSELKKCGKIRVPAVLHESPEFLLLEYIAPASPRGDFFERFGEQFAEMHRCTAQHFGFHEDNYIGATPQINLACGSTASNWAQFFWEKRLLFQFRLAEKNGYADNQMTRLFTVLEKRVYALLSGDSALPALLHGDLWSGNFLADTENRPVLVDPAVYYGHREADLAMTRLFGGFPDSFYNAYQAVFPLPDGWQEREGLYKLYHLLNHLNLFGTGYYGQCITLLKKYL